MNITYTCPACQKTARAEISSTTTELACPNCPQRIEVPADVVASGRLDHCLICPSKDFPQRLGVGLVVFGFVASSIAWYNYQVLWTFAILFLTALVDLVLYVVMGESLTCYRCHAQYRGFGNMELHGGFNLETHERYRQLAARMKHTHASSNATSQVESISDFGLRRLSIRDPQITVRNSFPWIPINSVSRKTCVAC
jgi:DNA-directed RNA polymerase subunit RPC12/RpoP